MIANGQIFYGEEDDNGDFPRVLATLPEIYNEPEAEFNFDTGSISERIAILYRWKYGTRKKATAKTLAAKGAVLDGLFTGRTMAEMSRTTGIIKQVLCGHAKSLREIAPWVFSRKGPRSTPAMVDAAKEFWRRKKKAGLITAQPPEEIAQPEQEGGLYE